LKFELICNGFFKTFSNNPHLITLIIENNRINQIGQSAFLGSSIRYLDLAGNPLGEFNPFIVAPIGETLRHLNLRATGLRSIQQNAFTQTPNITELTLSSNAFDVLADTVFAPLTQLESLILGSANLRNLNANWFATLGNLRSLYLPSNSIFELPRHVFNSLPNLSNLYIYSNNLRDLDTDAFGAAVSSIETIYASYNEIAGIDPTFLDSATSLSTLMLSQNNCTQENFFEIQTNREEVRNALGTCFANYVGETISCEYFMSEDGDYACLMSINNPIGRDAFANVPGQHLDGRSNDDVKIIDIIFQNTRNIPSIICQQFPNVEYFIAMGNNIDVITTRSFAGCRELEYLNLFNNHIVHIPALTFVNNTDLEELELGMNRIETLHPLSLEGTSLEYIDLAMNRINVFDPTWFEAVNDTLHSLDLLSNGISRLSEDAFRTVRNLETLVLSSNPLTNIPGNAFLALDSLKNLQLSKF
jgi:Leucine-rich repeat (LRR) protein